MTSLHDKIQAKIDTAQPEPHWKFILKNIVRITIITLGITAGIAALSSFFGDYFQLSEVLENQDIPVTGFVANMLLEFVVFAIITGLIVYFVYRQTDWPLVRNKTMVFSIIAMILLAPSVILGYLLPSQVLPQPPYRPDRAEQLNDRLQENGVFVGKIIDTYSDGDKTVITIANLFTQMECVAPRTIKMDVVGITVGVRFDMDDGECRVLQVRTLKRQDIQDIPSRPGRQRNPRLPHGQE